MIKGLNNKYIRVGIPAVLSLVLVYSQVVPTLGAADQTEFNTFANDNPTVQIANDSYNPGCSECWKSRITGVEDGDIISVAVYYHNTGSADALNTRVRIVPTQTTGGRLGFTGRVFADNARGASGSVGAVMKSGLTAENLELVSTLWFPNRSLSNPRTPNGNVMGANGVGVGRIRWGWDYTGYVIANFRVNAGNPQPPTGAPEVNTVGATTIGINRATLLCDIDPNGLNTQAWFVYGTDSDNLNKRTAVAGVDGQMRFRQLVTGLQGNTRYYFACVGENSEGRDRGETKSFTTTTNPQPPTGAPEVNTVGARNVDASRATLLCDVDPNGIRTNTRFLWGTSAGNLSNSTAVVTVDGKMRTTQLLTGLRANTRYYFAFTASNSKGNDRGETLSFVTSSRPGPEKSAPEVETLSASGVDIDSATLNCTVDANGASTNVWFEWGESSSNLDNNTASTSVSGSEGSASVSRTINGLDEDATYYYRCVGRNSEGTDYGNVRSFTTDEDGPEPSDLEVITGDPDDVNHDDAVLVCEVDGTDGEDTDVWIEYGEDEDDLDSDSDVETVDDDGDVSITVDGLDEDTEYFYRCVAENDEDYDTGSTESFTTDEDGGHTGDRPSATTLSATSVDTDSAKLRCEVDTNGDDADVWFEWGEDEDDLDERTSKVSVNDDETNQTVTKTITGLDEDTEYYFQCFIEDDGGEEDEGSVKRFTTDENGGTTEDAPEVWTLAPTGVTQTSAVLEGEVDANGSDTNVWFEWGTSIGNLTRETSSEDVGDSDNIKFDSAVTNLASDTTYYYRAVAENDEDTDYGAIRSFRTGAPIINYITRIVETIRPVRVVEEEEEVRALIITLDADRRGVDEDSREIDYTVSYDNRTNETFTNANLVVDLPRELNYVDSDPRADDEQGDVLTFDIGTISPDESGSFVITTEVDADTSANDTIRFVGDVNYTDSGTAKVVTVIDEHTFGELIREKTGGTFTALLLDSLRNFFTSPILWLILLVLLIYFAIRYFVAGRDRRAAALV